MHCGCGLLSSKQSNNTLRKNAFNIAGRPAGVWGRFDDMTMTIVPLGEPVPATFDRRVSPLNVCLCTLVMHYAEVAGSSLARALLDLTQRSAGPYEMSLGELRQCLVRRGLSDAEEYLSDIVGGVQYPDDIVDLFADFDRTINISTSENEYSSPIVSGTVSIQSSHWSYAC